MREFNLRRLDGKELHCYQWTTTPQQPIAVLQLVHGSAEHLGRYQDFAHFLNLNNILVVGDDHRGHGKTVGENKTNLGFFATRNGWKKIIDDEKLVNDYIHQTWPTLPVFMLGHSMGSSMARTYAIRYSKTIDGLILMGIMENSLMMTKIIRRLALFNQHFAGAKHRDQALWEITYGPFNRKFKQVPQATGLEWLSRDPQVQKNFAEDPLSGQVFTSAAFKDLMEGLIFNQQRKNIKMMRHDLPILLLAGSDDPVGRYGKYPQKVYNKFQKLGYNVKLKIYPGSRHEILNDFDKKIVESDLVSFIDQNTE